MTISSSLNPHAPQFQNFGELLYCAYSNLQMLMFALNSGKRRYDRACFMVRSKANKAYREGRWEINDLYRNNRWKMQGGDFCWYCGKEVPSRFELTADHVLPRSKGGDSSMDNLVMVCKSCNSSKGNMDLMQWFLEHRKEYPKPYVVAHYYKQLYLYAKEHALLEKSLDELDAMSLPFNWRYIVINFPQPEEFYVVAEDEAFNAENPNEAHERE